MAGFDSNDSGSMSARNSLFFRWFPVIRLSRVIGLLLIVLVFGSLVTHHYLSKVAVVGNNPEAQQTRLLKLEVIEEPGLLRASDLRLRIEELMRIKASVGNELRDLEKERQKYISEIGNYNQKVEELKVDVIKYQQELERFKLSVEQAKYTQKEALRKSTPDLHAPHRILPSLGDLVEVSPPSVVQSARCRMHSCFDHSRCSLTSGFPVYYYNPDDGGRPASLHLEKSVKASVTDALSVNPHITFDPNIACVFVVLLGSPTGGYSRQSRDVRSLERYLHSLAYWQGDGRNHILLNLDRGPLSFLDGMQTGRAMVVQSPFDEQNFRPGFDIVIPPLAFSQFSLNTNLWMDLPPLSPARRKFLIIFLGENESFIQHVSSPSGVGRKPLGVLPLGETDYNTKNAVLSTDPRNINESSSSLLHIEMNIVDVLKKIQARSDVTQDRFLFQFSCREEKLCGRPLEWCICEGATKRSMLLGNATFSLIIAPANWSSVSTALIQMLLFESLQNGAIPVVLGDYVHLAFSEFVDWRRAVVFLHKARVTELHFLLRTFTDSDIISMRHQGRILWERYMSSTRSIVDSLLATLRTRLKMPPLPSRQEASPSVFNVTFVPLKLEALLPDIDPDERMGPTEPPYPSPSFQRNFTSIFVNTYETWNRWIDPFYSYPYTPFDPILPSDAKFLGSGVGFRPIGHGLGGSGKEFTEALGGNVPKEQFTIVMLTYERESILINSLQRLYGVPFLNKVVVIWNSPRPPSEDLRWPDIGVPIHVVRSKKNSLNNRFLPYDAIETEAVLSLDDDAHLRHDEIMFGFRVWREARDRVVGFPGRYHAWDSRNGGWNYNANYTCELSMVLTGAAFFHKYYSYLYSYSMPQAIRDKVDEYMNCEDIAMNFLVSHITRKPPLKVTSRWTFRCPGCPVALSEDDTHFQERHKCINFFAQVYGYVPLLNTQFRVDSVLFKTRLPHGKQKCFKFI